MGTSRIQIKTPAAVPDLAAVDRRTTPPSVILSPAALALIRTAQSPGIGLRTGRAKVQNNTRIYLERMSPGTLAGRGLKTSACETLTGSPSLPCWWRRFLTRLSVVRRPRFCDSSWAGPLETEGSLPDGVRKQAIAKLKTGHRRFFKTEFNGDRWIANPHRNSADMRHFSPCRLRLQLASPQAGAASFGCSVVTCRAKHGLATTIFPRDGWPNEATRKCQSGH
jgi:hypothetical protein